ncbi:type IX secretion system membrane protein PorP/SprF [Flavobacterium sp.]|uniref:PorP/SprF family type IX secretion system membrane protein n=1 Tax=Flavobacterium sp. TaxID=239 RepID=UPI0025F82F15|nr:type IX secretion system membrane protein PorP/SprF [Flavobacterium sp.]
MKKIQNMLAIILLLVSSAVLAQQETVYTFYRQHMNLVNPAYAGVDSITVVSSTLRKQWTGIANAPETQAISFGTSLGKKVGFGMTVINDQTFIEKQTFVSLDFSYKLKMSETADVYFGIKAGGSSYNVNTSGLETYNVQADPALASISTFNPNIGVGAVYKEGPMYISLSIPRLLNTKKATNDAGYASVATDSPHIYLSGGYDVPLQGEFSSLILKPSAMLRYVSGAPVSLDLTAMLQIDKIFELGGMYRTDKAYAAMATVVISKRLVFGFAYEMSARPELARARNTNEMLLQFRF